MRKLDPVLGNQEQDPIPNVVRGWGGTVSLSPASYLLLGERGHHQRDCKYVNFKKLGTLVAVKILKI
jgi:hypothetical protein